MLLVGLAFGAIYFATFFFAIKTFNLKTPGREEDEQTVVVGSIDTGSMNPIAYEARQFTKALGGLSNLTNIDACITRLRLTMVDPSIVDDALMKAMGASGVIRVGEKNVQIILGPKAEIVAGEMKKIAPNESLETIKLPVLAHQSEAVTA